MRSDKALKPNYTKSQRARARVRVRACVFSRLLSTGYFKQTKAKHKLYTRFLFLFVGWKNTLYN